MIKILICKLLASLSTAIPETIEEANPNLILWIIGITLIVSIILLVTKPMSKAKIKSDQKIEIARIKADKKIKIKTIEANKKIELAKVKQAKKKKKSQDKQDK
ncbi:MAG: hypothetical protein K2G36_10080 [Ruminococcus sp.]|nr:hypothetical protein [Ruminococcus sp.]